MTRPNRITNHSALAMLDALGQDPDSYYPGEVGVIQDLLQRGENEQALLKAQSYGGFITHVVRGDFFAAWMTADCHNRKVLQKAVEKLQTGWPI